MVRHWKRLPREAVDAPGNVQGQVAWHSGQPHLMGVVPTHGRRAGTRWTLRFFTLKPLYDSTILCHDSLLFVDLLPLYEVIHEILCCPLEAV